MQGYRRKLGQWWTKTAGAAGGLVGGTPEKTGDKVYAGCVAVVIAVSVAIYALTAAPTTQFALSGLWGFLFGGAALLYFPSKMLTTIFGAIGVTGISDLTSLKLAIEHSKGPLEQIGQLLSIDVPLGAYWLFIVLIAVFCAPAYFRQ